MTNLRLPGQYDERLFAAAGITGLQGPYYNWNRWYLPSLGRYMELDPIAMVGGFNAKYGVDWYSYGNGNPLKYTDRTGNSAILIGVGAGLAIGTVWLFMHCMEKCTGVKVERPPTCEPAPDNNKIAKCANYCANLATLLGCIGVGEAAQCAITTVEQETSGGGN